MVVNGVTTQQLEQLLAIQAKSAEKLRFIPQAVNVQQSQLASAAFVQTNEIVPGTNQSRVIYNNVRMEWDADASNFAVEVLHLFTPQQAKQQQAG